MKNDATYSVQLIKNNDMATAGFGSHHYNNPSLTKQEAWAWIKEQCTTVGYDTVVVYNRGIKCCKGYRLEDGSYAWGTVAH